MTQFYEFAGKHPGNLYSSTPTSTTTSVSPDASSVDFLMDCSPYAYTTPCPVTLGSTDFDATTTNYHLPLGYTNGVMIAPNRLDEVNGVQMVPLTSSLPALSLVRPSQNLCGVAGDGSAQNVRIGASVSNVYAGRTNATQFTPPANSPSDGTSKGIVKTTENGVEEINAIPVAATVTTTGNGMVNGNSLMSSLSQRRRAQNRAAQRAFRERKEQHARDLEAKLDCMTEKYRVLESRYMKLGAAYERLKRTVEILVSEHDDDEDGGERVRECSETTHEESGMGELGDGCAPSQGDRGGGFSTRSSRRVKRAADSGLPSLGHGRAGNSKQKKREDRLQRVLRVVYNDFEFQADGEVDFTSGLGMGLGTPLLSSLSTASSASSTLSAESAKSLMRDEKWSEIRQNGK